MNPNTSFASRIWDGIKFPLPDASELVDFIRDLKTIAGRDDPSLKEGLAVHIYDAEICATAHSEIMMAIC